MSYNKDNQEERTSIDGDHKALILCNHCKTTLGVCNCCVGSIQTRTGCFDWSSPARFIKRDYNRSTFCLSVNNLIALPIPIFNLTSVLLGLLLITHLSNPVAIMIIIFIAFFAKTIRDRNSRPSHIVSTKYSSLKDHCSSFIRND